jgi:ethanolamine utilization protein EutA (predicted chaperonin)
MLNLRVKKQLYPRGFDQIQAKRQGVCLKFSLYLRLIHAIVKNTAPIRLSELSLIVIQRDYIKEQGIIMPRELSNSIPLLKIAVSGFQRSDYFLPSKPTGNRVQSISSNLPVTVKIIRSHRLITRSAARSRSWAAP